MKIHALTPQQARACVAQRYDLPKDASPAQRVAEVVRAELMAQGTCRRHVLKKAIAERTQALEASEDLITKVVSELEILGDITTGQGGLLAPGPTRTVALDDDHRLIFSGAPTSQLSQHLGCDLELRGFTRLATQWDDAHERSLREQGGLALSIEQWCGLTRAPAADPRWWTSLLQRLHASTDQTTHISHIVGDEPFQRYDPSSPHDTHHRRWVQATELPPAQPTLIRFNGYGRHKRFVLLTSDDTPPTNKPAPTLRWLSLSRGEARRLCFTLDDMADNPTALLAVEGQGETSWIESPNLLPYEEYRYLTAMSDVTITHAFPMKFVLPGERLESVAETLRERLSVQITPAVEGGTP